MDKIALSHLSFPNVMMGYGEIALPAGVVGVGLGYTLGDGK